MTKKAELTDVSSGYHSGETLNDNFTALNDKLENTLSRDGSTPNHLQADIDLNDNDILNVKDLYTEEVFVGGVSITELGVDVDAVTEAVDEAEGYRDEAEGFRDEAELYRNAALVITYEYTATEGQTDFTGADNNGNTLAFPDENVANVSRNGSFVDFTTSGTGTVTLDSAAGAGDEVHIPVYGRWSVGDIENPARYYSTREALVAAVGAGATFTDGQVVLAGQIPSGKLLSFVAKSDETAFSDLAGFLPGGKAELAHWGAQGTDRGSDIYPATPERDENEVIQEAMTWCAESARDLYGDPAKVYGTSVPLTWGATATDDVLPTGGTLICTLRDCIFAVLGGTWSTGDISANDPKDWTFGDPVLYVGKSHTGSTKYGMATENITVDGVRTAAGGILYLGTWDVTHSKNLAYRCTEYQQKVGAGENKYSCTDATFYACIGREWSFSDGTGTGFDDITQRTAAGLVIDGSDSSFVECVFNTSLHSLVLKSMANCEITGGKYWNGQIRTEATSKTCIISSEASRYHITGTRFDDGQVRIYGFHGGFSGCSFTQFQSNILRLVATEVDETAALFRFVGNSMSSDISGDNALLETEDSGTWGDFAGMVIGNQRNDGNPFCIGELSARLSSNTVVIGTGVYENSIVLGRSQATGGGDVARIYASGDEVIIIPTNQSGDFNYAAQLIGGVDGWRIEGEVSTPDYPEYADNAAATSGGLAVGKHYKTATGEVRIVV